MKLFTIGFTKKTAEQFFNLIKDSGAQIVIDVRVNTLNQLAGFAKGTDLRFFFKAILGINYDHRLDYAPSPELLKDWRKKEINWSQYEMVYNELIFGRKVMDKFFSDYADYESVCFLCSEASADKCHRRLFSELLVYKFGSQIEGVTHL